MARYRTKDDVDLRWNRIRRRVTRELDTQIADWREQALNFLLSEAWTEYTKQLENGDVRELEPEYTKFVGEALSQVIDTELPDAA